ncbi:transcription antitermination factor NusB [bacterium]|nr:transcription antitermination factor NusB [bacterium]
MGRRRQSREAAFQVLFSTHFTGFDVSDATVSHGMMAHDDSRSVDEFASRLLQLVAEHHEEIEETLDGALKHWTLERLSATDGALLRLGVAEILYMDDVAGAVTVNEYIELAKKFGDAESRRFVNGVLDRILKEQDPAKPQEADLGSS